MNGGNTEVRYSNEAMRKLQEKRNAVGRTILFLLFGVFLLIIPPVGIVVLLIGCNRVSKLRNEMKGLYKDDFVREPLNNNFDNVFYDPSGGFSEENVKNFQLCMMGNRFHSEDYIHASYAGVEFEIAEVKVMEVRERENSCDSDTYFEGRMMVFYFPNKLVNFVSAFSKKFEHRAISRNDAKEYRVELENIRFNNIFDVYSSVQLDAFYLITPHMMERLMVLAGKYESIAMNVVGNRVILAFNEPGKNVFDQNIDVGQLNIEQEMAKVQSEIDDIKTLIAVLLSQRPVA